ncbi:SURF1 family protein [Hellea balneolensis]|uniref:SURF1 family protein n=1 Tax=Hellea balneolensis TaxID=287478 RepID=UPI0003FAEE2C|nr:SURF1 family cytochrome oxidase biogenesis protein [Hellea balneolensis]
MKLHFKPMPWLTVSVAICLAILISLGTWQYQRLQWKTAYLADVDAAVSAPPLMSWAQLRSEIEQDKPVDFRRADIPAQAVIGAPAYFVYQPRKGGIYWRYFQQVTEEGRRFFAATESVPDADKTSFETPNQTAQMRLTGYVRKNEPMGFVESLVKSKASPAQNRYFKFDQTDAWGRDGAATDYYIDVVSVNGAASDLPVKRPEIRNNHLDYMLTWYSFAVILLIIYFILHYRAGRLKFS